MKITAEQHRTIRRALRTLERKITRQDEAQTRQAALSGDVKAARIVRQWNREDKALSVPLYLHTGEDIKTLDQMAALMGTDLKTTAWYVNETKGLDPALYKEARRVLYTMKSDEDGIALMLKFENPEWLHGAGEVATKPEDMHVTVAYFGEVGEDQRLNQNDLLRIARKIARKHPAFSASISGVTRFNNGSQSPVVLLMDAPDFENIRKTVLDSEVGQDVDRTHGYTPHVTLGYIDEADEMPDYVLPKPSTALRITGIQLGYGPDYTTYSLVGDEDEIEMAQPSEAFVKSLIRHVRTPEGARKYGQPIGSVIMRDVNVGVHMDSTGIHEVSLHGRAPASSFGQKKKIGSVEWEFNNSPEARYKRWTGRKEGKKAYASITHLPSDSMAYTYTSTIFVNGNDKEQLRFKTWDEAANWSDRMIDRVQEEYEAKFKGKPPRRTKRDTESFWDYSEGIYGQDWQWDDEVDGDRLDEDEAYRTEVAMSEASELGIDIYIQDHEYGVDPNTLESINTIHRTYESMYPGWTQIQRRYYIDNSNPQANAWNTPQWSGGDIASIGLNSELWSDDSGIETFANNKNDAIKSGWSALESATKVAEHSGLEEWQVAQYHTLNHEFGHTVARVIFGERDFGNKTASDIRQEFIDSMIPILKEYGVLGPHANIESFKNAFWPGSSISVDRTVTEGHVSEYGATNMHEFHAEVWVSYMLDESPTEFVQDYGAQMEAMFYELMKNRFAHLYEEE